MNSEKHLFKKSYTISKPFCSDNPRVLILLNVGWRRNENIIDLSIPYFHSAVGDKEVAGKH